MADPGSSVPRNGVFGTSHNDVASNFVNDNLNSDFDALFTFADNHMNLPLINPHLVGPEIIGNTIIPFEDDPPMFNNFVNEPGLGSSSLPNYSENIGRRPESFQIPAMTTSDNWWYPREIPHWPMPEVPFLCSCCQVLREIIHVNGGQHATKLEVHGRIGSICHAILENGQFGRNSILPGPKYQMFDFCKKSLDNVKEFLQSYCNERKQAGYVLIPEPLSSFYQAVSVGMDWDEHMNTDDFFEPSPLCCFDPFPANFSHPPPGSSEPFSMNFSLPPPPTMIVHDPSQLSVRDPSPNVAFQSSQAIPAGTTGNGQIKPRTRKKKTPLSIQRVRTKKLFSPEFVKYFHLPIEEAAKKLDVCVTVVKQKCRDGNVKRWPYRKVRSCEKKIAKLREKLIDAEDHSDRRQIESEIAAIQLEMANICGCPKCLGAVNSSTTCFIH